MSKRGVNFEPINPHAEGPKEEAASFLHAPFLVYTLNIYLLFGQNGKVCARVLPIKVAPCVFQRWDYFEWTIFHIKKPCTYPSLLVLLLPPYSSVGRWIPFFLSSLKFFFLEFYFRDFNYCFFEKSKASEWQTEWLAGHPPGGKKPKIKVFGTGSIIISEKNRYGFFGHPVNLSKIARETRPRGGPAGLSSTSTSHHGCLVFATLASKARGPTSPRSPKRSLWRRLGPPERIRVNNCLFRTHLLPPIKFLMPFYYYF